MSYNSISTTKTPDEIDLLAGLDDPDSEEKTLASPEEIQRELAARILQKPDCLKFAAEHLPAKAFTNKAHRAAIQEAYDFYGEYGVIPTPVVIKAAIAKKHAGEKSLAFYVGEANTLFDYTPETLPEEYLLDQIRDFAYATSITGNFHQITKNMGDPKKFKRMEDVAEAFIDAHKRIKKPTTNGVRWLTRGEIRKQATEKPINWVVDRWLMIGGLHMLAGSSFSGKSQFVADFATAIANGSPFGNMAIRQCPVIVLDVENHPAITDARLRDKIDDDSQFLKWLHMEDLRKMLPLKPETIGELVSDFYKDTGFTECVVFCDTLRSLFGINEQDPDQINGLFYPLQQVAQDLNICLDVLNHRPKTNADYAGHNAMMAALDFFAKYDRDEGSLRSTLSMVGSRLQRPHDEHFILDEKTLTLITAAGGSVAEITELVKSALSCGELNQDALVKAVKLSGQIDVGEKKLREVFSSLVPDVLTLTKNGATKLYSLAD